MGPPISLLPVLSTLYHIVQIESDILQLCNTSRRFFVKSPILDDLMLLLKRLDGTSSVQSLASDFGRDVVDGMLTRLSEQGLLQDDQDAIDRNLDLLAQSEFVDAIPILAQADVSHRVAASSITIVGCGVVGRAVALLLTRAGVGALQLADPSIKSVDDLVLHPLLARPCARGIGDGDRARLRKHPRTGACAVNLPLKPGILAKTGFAVIELSYERDGGLVNIPQQCLEAGVPYLPYSVDGDEVLVGPLIRAGGRPCHACTTSRRESHLRYLAEHHSYLRHRATCAPRITMYNPMYARLAATFIAKHVIRLICADLPPEETAWTCHLGTSQVSAEVVLRVPGCATCLPS